MSAIKIAFIGDVHMADPADAHPLDLEKRKHYVHQHDFVKKMLSYINAQAPDFVLFLGDVIDWYSPRNIAFALEHISALKMPWLITPGNHDYQLAVHQRPQYNQGQNHPWADATPYICKEKAVQEWNRHQVYFDEQKLNFGDTALYLADSALGFISQEQKEKLMRANIDAKYNIFATHVPLYHKRVAEIIAKHKGESALEEYIQDDFDFFQSVIKNRIQLVIHGHIHFWQSEVIDQVAFQFLPTSCLPGKATEFEGVQFVKCS